MVDMMLSVIKCHMHAPAIIASIRMMQIIHDGKSLSGKACKSHATVAVERVVNAHSA